MTSRSSGRPDASDRLTRAREKGRLVTVAELASWLQVEPSYVYEHADELGAMRLGNGPKARLRFDPEDVKRRISCEGGRESVRPDAASQAVSRRRCRHSIGHKRAPAAHSRRDSGTERAQ
jgi:hypothetical protein